MSQGVKIVQLEGEDVLRFDLDGRWFSASIGGTNYRRGLDHRVLAKPRPQEGRRFAGGRWLGRRETDALTERIHRMAGPDFAAWTPARYRGHAIRFRDIFGSIPILPPDQYLALHLRVTLGCSWNRCSFCVLYRGTPCRALDLETFRRHLEEVRRFLGRGIALRNGVFLGDANALALPGPELIERLEIIRSAFADGRSSPRHPERISAFQDTFDRENRAMSDYAALAELGLHRVYFGLETGHDPLRRTLAKPGRAAAAEAAIRAAKDAGLAAGVMVLLGPGGAPYAEGHLADTIALLDRLPLEACDRVFLSPLVVEPASPYAAWARAQGIAPLAAPELSEQAERLRAAVTRPGGPRTARYRVDDFIPY